jgi:hypothetical protein
MGRILPSLVDLARVLFCFQPERFRRAVGVSRLANGFVDAASRRLAAARQSMLPWRSLIPYRILDPVRAEAFQTKGAGVAVAAGFS